MRAGRLFLGAFAVAFLLPAVLLTAARLLDLPGLRWVQLVAFAPYALPLYVVALALLLLSATRSRPRWRWSARVLAGGAVVGAVLHAYWLSPFLLGTRAAGSAGTVQVMTSNLRVGGGDTARVVDLVLAERVDLLVLQEVTPEALSDLRQAGIDRVLAHTAGSAEPGVAGTMVFSRTPLTGVRRLGTGFASYVMHARLPGVPGGRVRLLAVHPRPPTGSAAVWRTDQRVVGRAARSIGRPTLVVGDLNATMDHTPLRHLAEGGYESAAEQANSGFQPTWPSSGMVARLGVAVPSLVAIDHVLVDDGLRAVRTESFEIEGTDHRAVIATLVPERAGGGGRP